VAGSDEKLALADTLISTDDVAATEPRSISRSSASLVGEVLDHFRVDDEIGRGGMGAVFRGWDTSLDRPVALKVLRDDITGRPDQEDRFLREARAQAQLNHPNVVHIYFIGHRPPKTPGGHRSLYFAMELVDGPSLEEDVIDKQLRLDPEQARKDMIEIANGLCAGLRAGIIHRDVKPSNLMRSKQGFVKIADFGLAKPLREDVKITQDGALVGSPLYMAPEQARGKNVDHRADMYALGATFFHLLAGRPPFDGRNSIEVVAQHLAEPPPSLLKIAADVPEPLAKIVMRLLAKDPEQRYATYEELIAALEEAAPKRRAFAGFWVRAAAATIDAAIAAGLIALIGWPGLVIHLLHVTAGHAIFGRTLAKWVLRLHVGRPDGSRLSILRSFIRTVVAFWLPGVVAVQIALAQGAKELGDTIEQLTPQQIASVEQLVAAFAVSNGFLTLLFGMGLAFAAFHPQKRALHDLAAGSVVAYRFR
jgi:uncharacterized RDD family membrane protein YckC